jgi:TolA-binding protein
MATDTIPNTSSSKLLHNYSSTSACDRPHCSLVYSEIKYLQAEVKSLSEIVNILSNERKMISQQESNKRTRTTSTSEEADSPTCGNCKKLELKLRTVNIS